MSDRSVSREQRIPLISQFTAADLIRAVRCDASISDVRRANEISAITQGCSWVGQEPHNISLSTGNIRLLFETVRRSPPDVTRARVNNVCSLFRGAVRRLGISPSEARKLAPLTEPWAQLFCAVDGDPCLKGCVGFVRYLGGRNILPHEVTQGHADEYEAHLMRTSLAKGPRSRFRAMVRAWNRLAEAHPGKWPRLRLDQGDKRKLTVLPLGQIDLAFRQDVEEMLAAFGSPLKKPHGFKKAYVPSTLAEMRRIYFRIYSTAQKVVVPQPTIASVRDLVTYDVAVGVLDHYLQKFGEDNTKSAFKYAHFLFLGARYWARLPKEDETLDWLETTRKTLQPTEEGMVARNRAMIRKFEDEGRIEALLKQGAQAVGRFKSLWDPSGRDALALQSAVAIELLIAAPVRPQNLASIDLERHIEWSFDCSSATLVFPPHEVKNRVGLEFKLPPRVVEILKLYLERGHPLLVAAPCRFLFPGAMPDRHKGPGCLSKQIAEATLESVKVRVTGHQFRHLIGYLFLKDHPGAHEVVRQFLGHKNISTTINSYAGMERAAALELVDRHVEAMRQRFLKARGA